MKKLVPIWMVIMVCSGSYHGYAGSVDKPVGASVEELLVLARAMNPELAATALEKEAALAGAEAADALPDPKFQVSLEDIDQNSQGLPGRVAMVKYSLSQEIPWWGKRDLKREIAQAESREAAGRHEEQLAEVVLKVKTAYADYHRVHLSMEQTEELILVVRTLVEFAHYRYAQGMGGPQEAISADVERGALANELIRLEKERQRIRSRLNTLLNRAPDAPLVEHPHLRAIPPTSQLKWEKLLEQGLAYNPGLRMGEARLAMADGERRLAEKNFYPDWEVGVGLLNRRGEEKNGFEAMVGMNLPLQWSSRQALERQAHLKKQAAQERLQGERLRVTAGLHEALLSLEESRQTEAVTRNSLLPQSRLALKSALFGYETGTSDASTVLDAIQRVKKFQIELLSAQYEQQVRLAEIERFVGGEL
ncbi:MAG: TolC family protein [Magnetococcales bacterium]|nr:TolC family protein [Magnetococcales bacterium]NGZ26467.1 TolC family protein [Magnetococcales bacterium]